MSMESLTMPDEKGMTLAELLTVIALIGILAVIGGPEINRFSSNYRVRTCATDLLQEMKLARSMAIKENRQYLITFDLTNKNYAIGPDADKDGTIDSVWRRVNLADCGADINYGTLATKDPAGEKLCASGTACFGTTDPPRAEFNPNGSVVYRGSVYFQHMTRGYSYLVRVSNNAGALNMWRWEGDIDNPGITKWIEIR
jgi:prepilin-type N-terminal cleavage/methylation domain-containing protein